MKKYNKTALCPYADTYENLKKNNDILLPGQVVYNLTNDTYKVGDGKSRWTEITKEYSYDSIDNLITREEFNSKLSSVYKYKGSVKYYFELPEVNDRGDVYNIINESGLKDDGYNMSITCNGVGPWEDSDSQIYISVNQEYDNNGKPSGDYKKFIQRYNGQIITVKCGSESFTGLCIGNDSGIIVKYRTNENDTDWYYYYKKIEGTFTSGSKIQVTHELLWNKEDCIVNAGDNVAWNGNEWDVLAGTITASNIITVDENGKLVININGVDYKITPDNM